MTLEEIQTAVQDIRDVCGDDEVAHGAEDDLHVLFIRHVAETCPPDLAEKARAVLTTGDIRFGRWCA